MFYALESPEEVEDLFVALHDVLGEDSREGGEVVHAVVKHKNLPAFVARRAFKQLNVKSTQEIRIMVLSIARSDGSL